MARKDSENQKKSMSRMFRGKAIFKPLNTGRIDEHVACVREWIANIFFYTKNGTTIMIDAGYNYERLGEKMGWLDIDPASVRQIFITHQDTDHVGALERDSELLFKDSTVYIGEIENRYLTGEARRKVIHGLYKLPQVKMDNRRILLKDGEIVMIGDIRVECILVPGHTWGHMVYLVDDKYLFTGDTIWFGADGGYSFLSTLAEDNKLAVRSLEKLEETLRTRKRPVKIITGHTGWTDDLDFAFLHRDDLCKPFTKKYSDPSAPYDGYVEDDDTEEGARHIPLAKVETGGSLAAPDYKNWVPEGMVRGTWIGSACCLGLAAVCGGTDLITNQKLRTVLYGGLLAAGAGAGGAAFWLHRLYQSFSYDGERQMARQIIEGVSRYVELPEDGVGLDVGCGSGALTIACARRNPKAIMVGCDIWSGAYKTVFTKKRCVDNARAEGVANIRFEEGNAIRLPYADGSFDCVTSNYVYHNIAGHDKQELLLETLRVLKKGGTFAVHDLMSKARYGDMDGFVRRLKNEGYESVRLIDTTDGSFMERKEARWLGLGGSTLLVGRK